MCFKEMLGVTLAVMVCVAECAPSTGAEQLQPQALLDGQWHAFKGVYQKNYSCPEEELHRRLVWEANAELVATHNREYDLGLHTYTLGLNRFADMASEEFARAFTGYKPPTAGLQGGNAMFTAPLNRKLPASLDWRPKGYVTPVKNQGRCGSCWAFSATGSLEGQHFKATGRLVSLSEQNLVDCSRGEGNAGCNGGWMNNAFKYIIKNGGINTEKGYPYTAKDGACRFNKTAVGATVRGYVNVKQRNETDLKYAVATVGPVSVAINAGLASFQLYKSGIYNDAQCSANWLNHAVLVVGYGSSGGKDFWIVKNSWGTGWGDGGYILMSRNAKNQCGIATAASYPLV